MSTTPESHGPGVSPDPPALAARKMRYDSAGRITHAAVNFLQAALTDLYPESPFAAAPTAEPPFDWPLDVVLWRPKFSDPAAMLVEAAEMLQLAYDLVVNESSFDDKAPTRAEMEAENGN